MKLLWTITNGETNKWTALFVSVKIGERIGYGVVEPDYTHTRQTWWSSLSWVCARNANDTYVHRRQRLTVHLRCIGFCIERIVHAREMLITSYWPRTLRASIKANVYVSLSTPSDSHTTQRHEYGMFNFFPLCGLAKEHLKRWLQLLLLDYWVERLVACVRLCATKIKILFASQLRDQLLHDTYSSIGFQLGHENDLNYKPLGAAFHFHTITFIMSTSDWDFYDCLRFNTIHTNRMPFVCGWIFTDINLCVRASGYICFARGTFNGYY